MDKMTFTDGVAQVAIELSPTFISLCFIVIVMCWLRLVVNVMAGDF